MWLEVVLHCFTQPLSLPFHLQVDGSWNLAIDTVVEEYSCLELSGILLAEMGGESN